jgi:hypothetical protein
MNPINSILDKYGGYSMNSLKSVLLSEGSTRNEAPQEIDHLNLKTSPYLDIDSFSKYQTNNENSINILSMNIQSINNKMDELKAFLSCLHKGNTQFVIQVICIQECWLEDKKGKDINSLNLLKLPNYQLYFKGSSIHSHKGGLITYIHSSVTSHKLKFFTDSPSETWEGLTVEITSDHNKKYKIHNVYRPPRNNHDGFIKEFTPYMRKIKTDNTDNIICGDMNYNLLSVFNNAKAKEFLDVMTTNKLLPKITLPTKYNNKTCNLYDHFFTKINGLSQRTDACILEPKLADHQPVMTSIGTILRNTTKPEYRMTNDYSNENVEKFLEGLQESISETRFPVELEDDPNECYTILEDIISKNIEEHIPKKKRKINKFNTKVSPWMTTDIMDEMRTEDILHRKLIRTPDTNPRYKEYKQDKKTQANKVKNLIRKQKRDYYKEQFTKYDTNIKNTWKTINDVTGRKSNQSSLPQHFMKRKYDKDDNLISEVKISGNKNIACELNEYYANIGTKLSEEIEYDGQKSIHSYLKNETEHRMNFGLIDDEIVKRLIGKIEPKSSSGFDNISSKLLLQMSPTIHPILRVIINQSLTTGIVPDNMKIAEVIPIYKGKDSDIHDFGNYRPISLLPAFSKVLEKAVHMQLYQYMNDNNLLNENQYGFRHYHSTEYAAIELVDRLHKALSQGNNPFAVFIDLSKAFDTLDHTILLKKLTHYGIRGTTHKWFQNYLGDRKQYVKYNNVTSPYTRIKTGVPQGSVLGPLLFIIYINDISNATKELDDILFADDTSLDSCLHNFFTKPGARRARPNTVDHIEELGKAISSKLDMVVEWLKINKLSLNTSKTRYMIFHNANHKMDIYKTLSLKMDGKVIKRATTFNYLGLTMNEKLTWEAHTNKLAGIIGSVISVLHRLKHAVPKKILLTIYNSLILSRFHYCNLIWGSNVSDRLESLQVQALRVITGYNASAHTYILCKRLDTVEICNIHTQKSIGLYWKILEKEVPTSIKKMFPDLKRQYENITPEEVTEDQMRVLRYRLLYNLNMTHYSDAVAQIEDHSSLTYNAAKKIIKKSIINRYPMSCHSLECTTCGGLENDETLPPKRKKWKKKNKKKDIKPPCPNICSCSTECKARQARLSFLYPNGIPENIPVQRTQTPRQQQRRRRQPSPTVPVRINPQPSMRSYTITLPANELRRLM